MTAVASGPVPVSVEIVTVGLSRALLTDLEPLVPAGSVLVLEEPEVIEARGAEAIVAYWNLFNVKVK